MSAGAGAGHVNVKAVRMPAGVLHQSHAAPRAIEAACETLREYSGGFGVSRGPNGPERC